jgi:hypothetical protein
LWFGAGAGAATWVLLTKIVTGAPVFVAHGPLLLLSAVLVETGVMMLGLGLLAELVTRIYMDGRHRRIYTIARRKTDAAQAAWIDPVPAIHHTPAVLQ